MKKAIKAGLIIAGAALTALYVYANIKITIDELKEAKRKQEREEACDLELLDLDILEDLDDNWD